MSLPIISGDWAGSHYAVFSDDGDVIVYALNSDGFSIKYTRTTKTWSDAANSNPWYFNSSSSFVANTSLYNPEFVHGFRQDGSRVFEFENTHYVTPPNTNSEGSSSGSCQLIYNAATNVMHYFMNATEPSTDMLSTRNLYYRVRNTTNVSTDVIFSHTIGTHTNGDFIPTVYGVYHLEKVLTNPLEVLSCDSAAVTQSNIVSYNAANTPPNTPRSRRGNLNFW
jgi:hypothetical protein